MSLFGLQTSNPAFTSYFWRKNKSSATKMSLSGIILKSILMLLLVAITAAYTWYLFFKGIDISWYTSIGMFVAIAVSLFISFKHNSAKYLLPIYALAKGFFLGGISTYVHKRFPGLPLQAIGVTIVTFLVMLLLFKTRIIKTSKQFRAVVITASITIFTIYMISWILSFFGISVPFIWGTSWIAIGFNILAAIVASLSLLLDFHYIEKQIGRAPKSKEWLATWGFLITLIWLYIEVLRLLKKLAIRF
ncbi:MAG: Bax inhibitor-1/YccA family protein [Polaribacter sp.]|uniref:Bax inhibitor-1/YccA family protein n=1 Tax=Polaribacter sp. TaxID=1920175 RepID=UPI002F3558F3